MSGIYLELFSDGISAVKREFEDESIPDDLDVLLATYFYECYSGEAFVLFRRDGKLYEVNAGHCSCYGLEDQWSPEETTVAALRHRIEKGTLGDGEDGGFKAELTAILDAIEPKGD